jgi:hypothetical protein
VIASLVVYFLTKAGLARILRDVRGSSFLSTVSWSAAVAVVTASYGVHQLRSVVFVEQSIVQDCQLFFCFTEEKKVRLCLPTNCF